MPEIGGYFGLETCLGGQTARHNTACLNSGRGVLLWLLPLLKPRHAFLPLYSCKVLYQPFEKLGIPYTLYNLNANLAPKNIPDQPARGELLLYINYNDACRNTAGELAKEWRKQMILDNTQAFFWRPVLPCWSFNSARKWMGVADGAYVYPPNGQACPPLHELLPNTNYTSEHLYLRLQGDTHGGKLHFDENEEIVGRSKALVSNFSAEILKEAAYESMKARRRANYNKLHEALRDKNLWAQHSPDYSVPMYYPFLPAIAIAHKACWQQQLYVPRLWPEVLNLKGISSIEERLASQLLPLPIDHRYNEEQMDQVILIVKNLFESR